MSTTVATGQITIVDLTDQRTSYFYLEANQSKIQTYNPSRSTKFEPNFEQNYLIITPHFLFGNDEAALEIVNQEQLSYIVELTASTNITPTWKTSADAFGTNECVQVGKLLYISSNIGEGILSNTRNIRIKATLAENVLTDNQTTLKNKQTHATIEFARADGGEAGLSISGVRQLYSFKETGKTPATPTQPSDIGEGKEWQASIGDNPPENKYLWLSTEIKYSNDTYSYTTPYTDPAWASSTNKLAVMSEQIKVIQGQVDSAIDTWYMQGDPTQIDFINPWKRDETDTSDYSKDENHVGDLYYDKDTGLSYRFLFEDITDDGVDNKVYYWKLLEDAPLSAALESIVGLQTEIDGKATIYYDEASATKNPKDGDLWIKEDGSFYEYYVPEGGGVGEWKEASITPQKIETQFISWPVDGGTPPKEVPADSTYQWSTESPTWEEGLYIWQRTKTTYNGDEQKIEYSEPACISAAAAKGITLTGEQAFLSSDGVTYSGPNVLTANCMGGLAVGDWYLKKSDGTWSVITANKGKETLEVYAVQQTGGTDFFPGGATQATIKVADPSGKYSDVLSLFKVKDGQKGSDSYSAFLTNENITFSANVEGEIPGTNFSTNVVVYKGTTKIKPTIGSFNSSLPSGMTISSSSDVDNEKQFIFAIEDGATLGGTAPQNGKITIPVTADGGKFSTNLSLNWSKVNTGATGAPGASAILADVTSPDGKVNFTDLLPGDIALKAVLYEGSTPVTSGVTYEWSFIPANATLAPSDENPANLTVTRNDVRGMMTAICKMTYGGKDYTGYITLTDNSDDIRCSIESTNGDKFTNSNIESTLICTVTVDGVPVKLDDETSDWVYAFHWKKYEGGIEITDWSPTYVANSHNSRITISGNDVNKRTIFSCEISRSERIKT